MTDHKKLLQQALQEIEAYWWKVDSEWGPAEGGLERAILRGEEPVVSALRASIAQPEQTAEPDDLTIAYMAGFADGKKAAQPEQRAARRDALVVNLLRLTSLDKHTARTIADATFCTDIAQPTIKESLTVQTIAQPEQPNHAGENPGAMRSPVYSFDAVNKFVHESDAQYEELQALCLGLVSKIEQNQYVRPKDKP